MDSEVIKIVIYVSIGVAILLVFVRLSSKPKKCAVCGSETKDSYKDTSNINMPLCRIHIIDRWKKDVIASTENMVVIEPDFDKYPFAYLYADIKKLRVWAYTEGDISNVSSLLDGVSGKVCGVCNKNASVAYFKKEDYEFPFMEKISAPPSYLCKICMTNKVTPLMSAAKGDFTESIYAPLKAPGIYHAQEF